MNEKPTIQNGIYLVVDPSMPIIKLLPMLEAALAAGVTTIQVWDHFPDECDAVSYTKAIMSVAERFGVPVLLNENSQLLLETGAHGIHFDQIPVNLEHLRQKTGRSFLTGITCGNEMERVKWAAANKIDYISFCSMFPSASAGTCEIVNPAGVLSAREIFKGKIFLSGGITPANMANLEPLKMDGIAVISGILSAPDPAAATQTYLTRFEQINRKVAVHNR